jgi:hypothetical protein
MVLAGNVRISDDRYRRDLRRLQLAWRLMRLGARTRTVSQWTGLSTYRLQALYRDYVRSGTRGERPHGTSPNIIRFFWRSAHLRTEGAVLAGFLQSFGALLPHGQTGAAAWMPALAPGELICHAFEQFRPLAPASRITVEHAFLLWRELMRGVEVAVSRCQRCPALILVDRLDIDRKLCAHCLHEQNNGFAYSLPDDPIKDLGEPTQGSLF